MVSSDQGGGSIELAVQPPQPAPEAPVQAGRGSVMGKGGVEAPVWAADQAQIAVDRAVTGGGDTEAREQVAGAG